jgi:Bacterial archaeo-eukaryotic release factor family 3
MTVTALQAPGRRPAPLPLPTPAEVLALQSVREYPAISILCSTDEAPAMPTVTVARLEQLVDDAARRLRLELGGAVAAALRDDLMHLVDDAKERPTRAAVALYVSNRHISAWGLPQPVKDRAVVDPTFATRDLVRSLHRTPRHVVLVLTEHEARLFDGAGDTLLPPFGGPFPLIDRTPRRHTRTGGGPVKGGDEDRRADTFFRTVDRALGTYLSLHPAPLVLVGAGRTLTRFTRISRNLARLAGTVQGSHARTPLPTLARLIRPVIEDYLRSREQEALALLATRSRSATVATGMPAVWLAARAERPEMLAVEEGLFYPARVSSDGDLIRPADDLEHPDVIDDAVDEVIETVLRRGGWVALVQDGALSESERIALTLRPR